MIKFGLVNCDLCGREGSPNKENKDFIGISVERNKNYSQIIKFGKKNETNVNKHICYYCVSDIVNKYSI